jgi:hypothetical protein
MDTRTEKLHLERETWNEAAQVAPGFWIIATHHRPGTSRFAPRINNRCLIFRLNDASDGGRPVLLAVNAIDPAVLPQVHRVERETGLAVRYLVSPGGGHSLWLAEWHDALRQARVLVGPARIPRLSSVKGLVGSPRFGTLDNDDPLPQFRGQVDFVNFDGLLAFPEILTPKEGGKDSRFLLIGTLLFKRADDPTDELWLCHRATHTCVGGENLGWILTPEHSASLGFPTRLILKPNVVQIIAKPRPVADPDRVAANWRTILAWPTDNLLTYHDTPGYGRLGGGGAALAQAVAAVDQAGED